MKKMKSKKRVNEIVTANNEDFHLVDKYPSYSSWDKKQNAPIICNYLFIFLILLELQLILQLEPYKVSKKHNSNLL